jgi:hypothetical protein
MSYSKIDQILLLIIKFIYQIIYQKSSCQQIILYPWFLKFKEYLIF